MFTTEQSSRQTTPFWRVKQHLLSSMSAHEAVRAACLCRPPGTVLASVTLVLGWHVKEVSR